MEFLFIAEMGFRFLFGIILLLTVRWITIKEEGNTTTISVFVTPCQHALRCATAFGCCLRNATIDKSSLRLS